MHALRRGVQRRRFEVLAQQRGNLRSAQVICAYFERTRHLEALTV